MEIEVIDKTGKKISAKHLEIHHGDDYEGGDYLKHLFNRYVNNRFRFSNACTKTRSQIAVTGAKPYRQKGTGNARRGVNNSPVRRGGAVAFGPQPRDYSFKLNKKVIKLSQSVILDNISSKCKILSSSISFDKTKDAVKLLDKLKSQKITLLITFEDFKMIRSFRNIKNLYIDFVEYFEPEMMLTSECVLFTENSFTKFEKGNQNG